MCVLSNKSVKHPVQLELESDTANAELLDASGAELPSEELIGWDAAKVKQQPEAETFQAWHFMIKELAVAFIEISSAVTRFKAMDPNSLQLLEVQRDFDERLACYKEIFQERRKSVVQSSLDKFIR